MPARSALRPNLHLTREPPTAIHRAVLQPSPAGGGAATVAPLVGEGAGAADQAAAVAEEGGAVTGELQPWHEGMALPSNPRADLLFPQSKAVVVVVNPGSSNAAAIGVPPGAGTSCQPTMAARRPVAPAASGEGGIEMIPTAAPTNADASLPVAAGMAAAPMPRRA